MASTNDNVIDLTLTSSDGEKNDNDKQNLSRLCSIKGTKRNQDYDHSSSSKRSKSNYDLNNISNRPPIGKTRIQSPDKNHLDTKKKASEVRIDSITSCNQTNKRPSKEKPTEFVLQIYKGDGDDGVVSTDILPLIATLKLSNVTTCLSPLFCALEGKRRKLHLSAQTSCPSSFASRLHVLYVMQNDKWSCGFRNLQMMLGSLMAHLPDAHRIRKISKNIITNRADDTATIDRTFLHIPSVRQLQCYMEESWKDGFDEKGANHFNHSLRGQKSKIGAVEVSSLLAYLGIDSTVVQFVACYESRSKLGDFVWAYFSRKMGRCYCYQCSLQRSSTKIGEVRGVTAEESNHAYSSIEHVRQLLSVSTEELGENSKTDYCEHSLLPLYLQWEGHSVTIVGIEKVNNSSKEPYQLLIFDPVKRGNTLKNKMNDQSNSMHVSTKCLAAMKLSPKSLLKKDCQIVLCTSKPLSKLEKEAMKDKLQVVTAAWRDVETYVSRNNM